MCNFIASVICIFVFLSQVPIGLLKLREVLWLTAIGLSILSLQLHSASAAPVNFNQGKELLASEGSDEITIHVDRMGRKTRRECRESVLPAGTGSTPWELFP